MRTRHPVWPVLISLVLFPLLRFGVGERSGDFALSAAALTLAYVLAVHLYYGLALIAHQRRSYLLWGGGLVAAVFGCFLSGVGNMWMVLCGLGMIFFGGAAVGRVAGRGYAALTTYVAGLAIVVSFALVLLVPQWPEIHRAASVMSVEMIQSLRTGTMSGLLGAETAEAYALLLEKASGALVRLLPMALVMSSIAQYSVGFLWFADVHFREEARRSPLQSFIYWRVPTAVLLIVVIALFFRLAGGETVRLVADNLLAALSLYYCVTGLALVEYYLRRLRFHWSLKTVVYLLLIPAGLIGYFILVLLGLVTSLYDWRKDLGTD